MPRRLRAGRVGRVGAPARVGRALGQRAVPEPRAAPRRDAERGLSDDV